MRRISFVVGVLAFAVPVVTRAELPWQSVPEPLGAVDYEAVHGVLYIPVESVTLVPVSECSIPQGGADNTGLGCTYLVDEESTFDPVANIDEIVAGVSEALAPYGVIVATTRPESYLPYQMVIPGANEDPKSTSASCVIGSTDCDGIDRRDIAFTVGGTAECNEPDPVRTVLIAFGRMSGLEGKVDAADVMGYPPDFTTPVTTFVDQCDLIVTPENPDTMLPMPLACPSSYHEQSGMCAEDDNQNSHAELLAVYGPATAVDTTPPTIGEVDGLPDEGAVLPSMTEVDLVATITDDSGVVAVRMTYESMGLEVEFGVPEGMIDKCTAGSCGVHTGGDSPAQLLEFQNGNDMAYPDQSAPWRFDELPGLPDGDYTVTIEASDLSGNVVVPIVRHFTVGDGGSGTEGGSTGATTTGAESSSSGPSDPTLDVTGDLDTDSASVSASASDDDTNDDENGGDIDTTGGDIDTSGTDDAGMTEDVIDRGCGCTTTDRDRAPLVLLVGLAGLVLPRRRSSGSPPRT
jgi:MYXO-CTERM domain-containing protein